MSQPRSLRSAFALLIALSASLAAVGCQTTPDEPEQAAATEQYPTIAEIRSQIGRRGEERVTGPIVSVDFDAFSFAREIDTSLMWKPEMQASIPLEQRRRWEANGLRIGVLKRRQARNIVSAIPTYAVASQQVMPRKGSPHPVRLVPRHERGTATRYFNTPPHDLVAELRIPPADLDAEVNPTVLNLPPGTFGFLVEVEQMLLDKVLVKVTPQYHWLEPSLRPRSPFDSVTDGKVFDTMSVSLLLDAADMLVIGYHAMPPLPEPKQDETDTDAHDPIHDFPLENMQGIEGIETAPSPSEEAPVERPAAESPATVNSSTLPRETTTVTVDPPARTGNEAAATDELSQPERKKKFVPMPRIGEMLMTYTYRKEPAQMLLFITPEVIGQVLDTPVNPTRGADPNVIDNTGQ